MQHLSDAWVQLQPIVQDKLAYAYNNTALIAPYVRDNFTPVVFKSSIGGALGGQLITLLAGSAGNKIDYPLSLALAYAGAEMMNAESNATLWLTTGLYAVPLCAKIIEKVAVQVISGGILKTAEVAVYGTFYAATLPFQAVSWALSGSSKTDKLEKKLQKQEKELQALMIDFELQNQDLDKTIEKLERLQKKLEIFQKGKVPAGGPAKEQQLAQIPKSSKIV